MRVSDVDGEQRRRREEERDCGGRKVTYTTGLLLISSVIGGQADFDGRNTSVGRYHGSLPRRHDKCNGEGRVSVRLEACPLVSFIFTRKVLLSFRPHPCTADMGWMPYVWESGLCSTKEIIFTKA